MELIAQSKPTEQIPTSPGAVIRQWAMYGLGSVAGRLASFLLLPIYTRFLSPTDYGIKAMVVVGTDVVGIFVGLGIRTAMIRFYWGEDGKRPHPEAISTGLFLMSGLVACVVGMAFWESPLLAGLVFGDPQYAPFLRLGLISLFFSNVLDIPLAHLQIKNQPRTFVSITLASMLTAIALNVFFVIFLRLGVEGILYSEIITHGLFCLLMAGSTLREVGWSFSPAMAGRMIRYGAPLSLMPVAWMVITRADRLFLTHYGSLSEVGIYAVAVQFAQILFFAAIQPFANVWDPSQFEVDRQANADELISRIFHLFVAAVLILAFGFSLLSEDIITLMAAAPFWRAAPLVPMLVLFHALVGVSLFFNSGLLITKRTGYLSGIAMLTAGVNVACNALLAPHYFATGAALSKIAAGVTIATLTYAASQQFHPRNFRLFAIVKPVGYAVGLFLVSRYLPQEPLFLSLLLKAGLVLSLTILLVCSDLCSSSDRQRIWQVSERILLRLQSRLT